MQRSCGSPSGTCSASSKEAANIIIERRRIPAAVLISLDDYEKRFADRDADEKRKDIVRRIIELQFNAPSGKTTLDLLRASRSRS